VLPEPLHPAVVHFPMALAALLPGGILLALVALRTGFLPLRAWVGIVLVQVVLGAASLMALETGEGDEERVEAVVSEAVIEAHEARADRFVIATLAAAAISLGGLLRGAWGEAARIATLVASALVLVLAIQVGHSGGELVYRHGAALAYSTRGSPVSAPPAEVRASGQHSSDDED